MEEKGEAASCLWVLRRFFSDGEQFFLAGGIANVATHPAFWGRGFASQLLERVINVARKEEFPFLVLVTDISSFYERFGFKDCKKWVSQVEPEEGKSIEMTKPQTGEILGCYRTFYQKRRLLTPVRNYTYLRGMRRWNRYSAGFETGKEIAFWGKGEGEIGYFLNKNQAIEVFDVFFSETPEKALSFLRGLGKSVRLFRHLEVLGELGLTCVPDQDTVMVLPLRAFPERLYLPPADYF